MTEFARLLAKIAHSYAIAELGFGSFESILPPVILGEAQNLPDFVGGIRALTPPDDWFLGVAGTPIKNLVEHYLNWEVVLAPDRTPYLTVVIQLLNSYTPRYRVAVAKLDRRSVGLSGHLFFDSLKGLLREC